MAKAWIGSEVETREVCGTQLIEPLDRIRERKEPFRDEHGTIVPAGALGKYFELRDQEGKWQPIHPADIRRYERPKDQIDPQPIRPESRSEEVKIAVDKGNDVFRVMAWKRAMGDVALLSDRRVSRIARMPRAISSSSSTYAT